MLKIDLHIHTIASGHAHNTILEYINQAKKLKMSVIGISDHGPGYPDSIANELYFKTMRRMPETVDSIRLLKGVEANIINKNGKLDISDDTISMLDYVLAAFHSQTLYGKGSADNTSTMIKAINSGKIDILSHPFDISFFNLNLKKIFQEACKKNVLLELDLSYLSKYKSETSMINNMKIMVDIVKLFGNKIIIGSDSHNIWELGDDENLKKIKRKIGLTDDMIINNCPKELFKLLKIDE